MQYAERSPPIFLPLLLPLTAFIAVYSILQAIGKSIGNTRFFNCHLQHLHPKLKFKSLLLRQIKTARFPEKGKTGNFFRKNNLVCLTRSCPPFSRCNLPIVSTYARSFLKGNENHKGSQGIKSQRIKNKRLKGFPNRGGPGGVRKEIRDGLTAGGILHIIIPFYPLGRAVYEAFFGGSLL